MALSRALGHHSASFTLAVYAHLLEGEQAPALDLGRALHAGPLNGSAWGSDGSTHPTEHGATLLSGVSDCARYFPDPNAP